MAEATIEGLPSPCALRGESLRIPPSNGRSDSVAPCLSFSDASQPPATKGTYPLGFPNDVTSQGRCLSRKPGLAGRQGCLSEASGSRREGQ